MDVYRYSSGGGKDKIVEYLESLPNDQKAAGYELIEALEDEGLEALEGMNTRQLDGKLWEIKFYRHNRIMYVLLSGDSIYLLHACQKQKGKAEKFELETAKRRMREVAE